MPDNCFLCDEATTLACQDCCHTDGMNLFCSSCDELFHKRRDRAEHTRGNIPSVDEEAAGTTSVDCRADQYVATHNYVDSRPLNNRSPVKQPDVRLINWDVPLINWRSGCAMLCEDGTEDRVTDPAADEDYTLH